jgi:penicillin-binding protein 1C
MIGGVEAPLEDIVSAYQQLSDRDDPELFLLEEMLRNTMNRSLTFGVSSILNTSIPLAVKTGTSTDFRDNWTVGYSPEVILGVWVGNTDRSSMDDVSGVT